MKKHKNSVAGAPSDKAQYKGKGALDAFLNLLSLISLGWTAWAVGVIYFELIYRYLEMDSKLANISVYSDSSMKYGIASLLIIGPVYFLAVNLLHLKYKKNELNHNSGIYRWLTYLMLLASALGIIGSLIALVASFLNGDYSLAIILKILVVMAIAGFIFGYYFYDLKRQSYAKIDKISAGIGAVVVIIMLIAAGLGFMNVETPAKTRARLLDNRKENALISLMASITSSYSLNKKVPDKIDNLAEWVSPGRDIVLESITYRRISDKDYELCVDFKTDSYYQSYGYGDMPWAGYKAGHHCYQIDANTINDASKQMYPNVKEVRPANIPTSETQPVM